MATIAKPRPIPGPPTNPETQPFWDAAAQAPFLWNARQRIFISYDDPESLRVKCRYLKQRGLAGVMFWQYYSDETGALLDALDAELRPRR